jgi:hypothetical protein
MIYDVEIAEITVEYNEIPHICREGVSRYGLSPFFNLKKK